MLESLEQNNIKRMSVEEPETEFVFDPKRDLSREDWENILSDYEVASKEDHGLRRFSILEIAKSIKMLKPDFNHGINIDQATMALEIRKDENTPTTKANYYIALMLDARRALGLETDISNADINAVNMESFELRERQFWPDYIMALTVLKNFGLDVKIPGDVISQIKFKIDAYRRQEWWGEYLRIAWYLKQLGIEIRFEEEDIKGILKLMEVARQKKLWRSLVIEAAMFYDLTKREKIDKSRDNQIPEQRNF